MNTPFTINVAGLPVSVQIKDDIEVIASLFEDFDRTSEKPDSFFFIEKSNSRKLDLSTDTHHLTIGAPDIQELSNPYNVIGIYQAFFRLVGLAGIKKGIFLAHGSAVVWKNKYLLFADDGESTGKSISSIICGLSAGSYIGDEFCFINEGNLIISGFPSVPIHIRPGLEKYLEKEIGLKLPSEQISDPVAGSFIKPKILFKNKLKKGRLDAAIFVHFGKRNSIRKLGTNESKQALGITLSAHIMKLLYPPLDHMSFVDRKDSPKITSLKNTFENFLFKNQIQEAVEKISSKVDCFEVTLSEPIKILDVLSKQFGN